MLNSYNMVYGLKQCEKWKDKALLIAQAWSYPTSATTARVFLSGSTFSIERNVSIMKIPYLISFYLKFR